VATEQAQQQSGEASDGATGKAKEVAAQAKEQVQQKTDEVKGKASERVRTQLDSQSTSLGEQVIPVSQALRKAGEHLQGEGNSGGAKAAHRAADQLDQLAGYLKSSNSDRFLRDLERFGRKQPWAAGGIGAALGFVAARFVKASSEGRYETTRQSQFDANMPISRDGDATAALPPMPPMPSAPTPGYRSQ
jgi:ElaB/YqjD/DUF883 family membrane-anchored ribosome-binding protein